MTPQKSFLTHVQPSSGATATKRVMTALFTVYGLLLAGTTWATPITTTFTVAVPCGSPNLIRDSPTAVTLSGDCTSDPSITASGLAEASAGHLGVSLSASESAGGFIDSNAQFSTSLLFTPTGGATAAFIPVQLNLGADGDLFASRFADVSWRLSSSGFHFDYLTGIGFDPTHRSTNIDFIVGGESLNGGVHTVAGEMQSAVILVPVGTPVAFDLELSVGGFGSPGSFGGDFVHSVDFPIGADVFTLPDGFTVNDPDMFLFDNRFTPTASGAVPEPASLLLLGSGILVARRFRRSADRSR